MAIRIWQIRKRFSFPGHGRLVITRALPHPVLPVLIESLHYKIRRGDRYRKGYLWIIGRRRQCKHAGRRRSNDPDFADAFFLKHLYGLPESFQRIVVVPIILLGRSHCHYMATLLMEPLDPRYSHAVIHSIAKHENDSFFCVNRAFVKSAIKPIRGRRIVLLL